MELQVRERGHKTRTYSTSDFNLPNEQTINKLLELKALARPECVKYEGAEGIEKAIDQQKLSDTEAALLRRLFTENEI